MTAEQRASMARFRFMLGVSDRDIKRAMREHGVTNQETFKRFYDRVLKGEIEIEKG